MIIAYLCLFICNAYLLMPRKRFYVAYEVYSKYLLVLFRSQVMQIVYEPRKQTICVTAQLITALVFATRIVQSPFLLNLKNQALIIFGDYTARIMSDKVVVPNCCFSHAGAHILFFFVSMSFFLFQCILLGLAYEQKLYIDCVQTFIWISLLELIWKLKCFYIHFTIMSHRN